MENIALSELFDVTENQEEFGRILFEGKLQIMSKTQQVEKEISVEHLFFTNYKQNAMQEFNENSLRHVMKSIKEHKKQI